MKKKVKFALEELEKELSIISKYQMCKVLGGSGFEGFPVDQLISNFLYLKQMGTEEMINMIGGNVQFNFGTGLMNDTCAVRMSLALNMMGSGYALEQGNDGGTISGDYNNDNNKEWYNFRALDLGEIMSQYGETIPINSLSDIPEGAKGVIIYRNFKGVDSVTGQPVEQRFNHIDMYDGSTSGSTGSTGSTGSNSGESSGSSGSNGVLGEDYSTREGVIMEFIQLN